MDDFLKLFEGFVESSKQYATANAKPNSNKWKFCVALSKIGWKAFSCDKIDDKSNSVIIRWKKEGKKDIFITLSFAEQCMWIEYLDKKEKQR